MKKIKSNSKEVVQKAIQTLEEGGLLIYPTETCYGIGADATNQKAINKLIKYKSKREGKPISIAVNNVKMAEKYVKINNMAKNIYDNYLPGPITVVSKSKGKVAEGIEADSGTIGIRIPDQKLILEIIKNFGKPITSTSANMSYGPRPYSIEGLLKHLPQRQKNLIDLIIDSGKLTRNEPSTVVDTTLNNLNIMRKGKIQFEQKTKEDNLILEAKTNLPKETTNFGKLNMLKFIDTPLEKCLIFLLSGELGAGKTQFTKGIAEKLDIKKIIKSPTFTIINEYDYQKGKHRKGKLIHIDTWRIQRFKELQQLGLKNYIKKNNIVVIEWADKFYDQIIKELKNDNIEIITIKFKYLDKETREIKTFK